MAIKRSDVKIYIAALDTNPSALAATDVIEGEITNYEISGGNRDVESVPAFGGFIDKEKPVEQYEITLEVVPSLGSATAASRWESIVYGLDPSNAGVYTPAIDPSEKVIGIQALSGTTYNSYAFNNCNITDFSVSHAADDNRTATLTFKFSPQDEAGIPNLQTGALAISALKAWTSLSTE